MRFPPSGGASPPLRRHIQPRSRGRGIALGCQLVGSHRIIERQSIRRWNALTVKLELNYVGFSAFEEDVLAGPQYPRVHPLAPTFPLPARLGS